MVLDRQGGVRYPIGMTLKAAREKAGLSQAALARAAGTSQPQIGRLEAGERTLDRDWAERLAPHLGVTPESLVFGDGPLNFRPPPVMFGERDLPVYSAVEGGAGEMVVSTDPIEIVPRPWYLREVREGFAVLVTGDSMEPAFEPGDMAIVNPRLPPMRNRSTIFVSGEERGEFRATIKRLISWNAGIWRVRQYNEPKDFDLDRREWTKALRVVGKLEGA